MITEEKIRENFAKRLNLACKNKGLPDKGRGTEIAKIVNVTPKAVSKWFNGETMPSTSNTYILADFLGVSPEWLTYGEDMEFEIVGRPKEGVVPVIGEATMGRGDSVYLESIHTGYVKIFSNDKEAYCLRCKGSSMEPRIHSGEFMLIEPNTAPCEGDDVLVRTVDEQYMIKTYERYQDGEYRFSSINHDHPPFNLQENEVVYIHTVSAILKRSRFVAFEEMPEIGE